jgi:hypothetical protein
LRVNLYPELSTMISTLKMRSSVVMIFIRGRICTPISPELDDNYRNFPLVPRPGTETAVSGRILLTHNLRTSQHLGRRTEKGLSTEQFGFDWASMDFNQYMIQKADKT